MLHVSSFITISSSETAGEQHTRLKYSPFKDNMLYGIMYGNIMEIVWNLELYEPLVVDIDRS